MIRSSRCLLVMMVAASWILVSCDSDSGNGGSGEIPSGNMARVSGVVRGPDGAPVSDWGIHLIYEDGTSLPPGARDRNCPLDPPSNGGFDIPAGFILITITLRDGISRPETLFYGESTGGEWVSPFDIYRTNGVYDLRIRVDQFESTQVLVKNSRSVEELLELEPIAVTNHDGRYTVNVACGDTIQVRDINNQPIRDWMLNRVTFIALREGAVPEWRTGDVLPAESFTVDIAPSAEPLPPGIIAQLGDTIVVIPDSAVVFKDSNFVANAYWLREYQVATNANYSTHPYTGSLNDWKQLPWSQREEYMVPTYNHDLIGQSQARQAIMTGTLNSQFGFGWRDTFDPNADLINPANPQASIWEHPADPMLNPDNPATVGFDGDSRLFEHYRNMWIRIPG